MHLMKNKNNISPVKQFYDTLEAERLRAEEEAKNQKVL